jgi:RHS repeat-associated protein
MSGSSSSSSFPDGITPICCCCCDCYEGQAGHYALLNGCDRLSSGTISPSVDAIGGQGLGVPFDTRASYGNVPTGTVDTGTTGPSMGTGWRSHDLAGLTFPASGDEIYFREGPNQMEVFVPGSAPNTWRGAYYVRSTIVKSGSVYTMTLKDGSRKTFALDCRITGIIGAGGQTLTVAYSGSGATARVASVSGSTGTASVLYDYEYDTSGRVFRITLILGEVAVRRAVYSYWSSGLLQKVEAQEKRGAAWLATDATFFRYHAGNTGLLHFILGDEALHRMASVGLDPASASDDAIKVHADTRYSYDSNSRPRTLATEGGANLWTLEYDISGFSGTTPSEWTNKTVATLCRSGVPDTVYSVETVYFNRGGSLLLKKVEGLNCEGEEEVFYPVCQAFDSRGRVVRKISAAAIETVDENLPNLFAVRAADGLIEGFSYADDQGGGIADEWVQKGSGGVPILQRRHTWQPHPVASPAIWLPDKVIVFLNESGTVTAETSFAYTFHAGTLQIKERTTTLPAVPAAENGTGVAATTRDEFDLYGFRISSTDENGVVTTYVPNIATGGMKRMTVDPGGLNLVTDYVLDDEGRTILKKGPVHEIDLAGTLTSIRTAVWTCYRDPEHQRITFPGYIIPGSTEDLDTCHCVGPVKVEHGFVLPATPDGTSFSATTESPWELTRLPQPDDVYPQSGWTRWQSRQFSQGGRMIEERLYHLIPVSGDGTVNTNYALTGYAHDPAGRVDRITTPGGTVEQTVFNALGRVTNHLTGTAAGNMKATLVNVYDGDSVHKGDGLLTKATVPVDDIAANDRITVLTYDWRQRKESAAIDVELEGSSMPVKLIQADTYDNRSLVTDAREYRTSVSPGNLQGWSQTMFDVLGRPFRRIRHEVDAATGAVGNSLKDNTWYDPAGRVVVRWPAGSQAFENIVYDAAGRAKNTYTAYQPGWTSGMPLIAQSIVMAERFVDYDPAGNVRYTRGKERYDTATGTGPLKDHGAAQPQARVTYVANYPDAIGRTVATANYGTNGNAAWTRSPLIPACTDDVLVNLTAFNPKGEPFHTTDPMLAVTTQTWDAARRLIETLEGRVPGRTHPAIDRKTKYKYNPDGNITKLKVRNNTASGIEIQETIWTYGVTTAGGSALNSNLLVRTKTYPDSAGGSDVVTYTYNRPGQVTTTKDQSGLVHSFSFDATGRQIADEVTSWGSSTVDQTIKRLTKGYDARGLVAAARSFGTSATPVNSVTFQHNGWRQLIEETQSHEGGTARTIVYGYATGVANTIRRTSMTYPSGQSSAPVLNYIYNGTHANELSRVSAIRDGGTDIISYKWLGVGNPVDINYNVPATHLSYGTAADHYAGLDRFGRPVSVPWLKDGSPALVHAQYRYDRSSNRQWRRDAAAHAAGVTTEDQWYEYDGLYQVGEFQRGTLSGSYPNFSGITPVAQYQDWNYDAMGNWLGFQSDALSQTRQFNKVNEITSINGPSGVVTPLYDPVGNMTIMPAVSNWTTAQTLKWDAWNRLVKVSEGSGTIAEYSYDAIFRRVAKVVDGTTRRFYYNDQWQILEEYLGSVVNPEMRYWYGLRDINDIARRQRYSSGTTVQDDLYALRETMNVVALVNSSGIVTQRMAYDAFGAVRFLTSVFSAGSNADGWNLLFHGHYRDADTGLYQMRFRYYHPNLGVWLSRDPLGDAVFLAHVSKGVSAHERRRMAQESLRPSYLFVSNDPLNQHDKLGLTGWELNPYGRPWQPGDPFDGKHPTVKACSLMQCCVENLRRLYQWVEAASRRRNSDFTDHWRQNGTEQSWKSHRSQFINAWLNASKCVGIILHQIASGQCTPRPPELARFPEYQRRVNELTDPGPWVPMPMPMPAPAPASSGLGVTDWEYWEEATGLTGAALVVYLIFSEGSRLIPARNLIPVP